MKKLLPLMLTATLLVACNQASEQQTTESTLQNTTIEDNSAINTNNHIKLADIRQDNIGGDFSLTDGQGKTFNLSNLKGKVVILAFGFTNCPDVCPSELFTYNETMQLLGKQSEEVAVVFVSVDPERDTPDLIGRYTAQFNPQFIGLTDTTGGRDIALVKQLYRIVSAKTEIKSDTLYNVDHSSGAYIIDKNGDAVYFAPYGIEAPQIAEGIKPLLAQ